MNKTILKRQTKDKELLLVQFKKMPIIQAACDIVGVARASYYRWRDQDEVFREASDKALAEGEALVNDVAESQLLTLIKEANLGAIVFWLKSHHPAYASKLEVMAKVKNETERLTPEQEKLVTRALELAGALTSGQHDLPDTSQS